MLLFIIIFITRILSIFTWYHSLSNLYIMVFNSSSINTYFYFLFFAISIISLLLVFNFSLLSLFFILIIRIIIFNIKSVFLSLFNSFIYVWTLFETTFLLILIILFFLFLYIFFTYALLISNTEAFFCNDS